MKTRMEKYYDEENNNIALRQQKNESLYENLNDYEVDDYKIEANATVLDNNAKNIDVEKIKKILDTKYNKSPKRRSIVVDDSDYEEPDISLDETREYDINAILERARSEKEDDYEKERLKKIRDTQYDILNSLDIEGEEKDEEKTENNELMDLINTITAKELEIKEQKKDSDLDPLDILTDLKGSDDTEVYESMTEEIKKVEEQDKLEETKKDDEEEKKENTIVEKVKDETMDSSFYTTSLFKKHDFADDEDDTDKGLNIVIKILIVLVIICFLVGIFLFVRSLIME